MHISTHGQFQCLSGKDCSRLDWVRVGCVITRRPDLASDDQYLFRTFEVFTSKIVFYAMCVGSLSALVRIAAIMGLNVCLGARIRQLWSSGRSVAIETLAALASA